MVGIRFVRSNGRRGDINFFSGRHIRKEEMEGVEMKSDITECETCQGQGEVFQESGAGIHATANMGWVECPDCDGKGEIS